MVKKATDGHTVVSTIDATLQEIAEKYINKFIEDYTNKNTEGPAAKNIGRPDDESPERGDSGHGRRCEF